MIDLTVDADAPEREDHWRTVIDYMGDELSTAEWVARFADVEPAEIVEYVNAANKQRKQRKERGR